MKPPCFEVVLFAPYPELRLRIRRFDSYGVGGVCKTIFMTRVISAPKYTPYERSEVRG